jgi:hypothetical protein
MSRNNSMTNKIIDNRYNVSNETVEINEVLNTKDFNDLLTEHNTERPKDNWIKLDKTTKVVKINEFVDTIYAEQYKLQDIEIAKAKAFIIDLIQKKRLTKAKDITYNKTECKITAIPSISYNPVNKSFSINNEKRVSSLKSLPGHKRQTKHLPKHVPKTLPKNKGKSKTTNSGDNKKTDQTTCLETDVISDNDVEIKVPLDKS